MNSTSIAKRILGNTHTTKEIGIIGIKEIHITIGVFTSMKIKNKNK